MTAPIGDDDWEDLSPSAAPPPPRCPLCKGELFRLRGVVICPYCDRPLGMTRGVR